MKKGFRLVLLRTRSGRACWLPALLLLATTVTVKAGDYTYTTNSDNTINITKYTGIGGVVTIPSTTNGLPVTSIGDSAFASCASLTAITVDAANSVYSSVDGILFNKSKTTLIRCPGGKAGSYTIPNSVTSIGNGAFESCAALTSITIPNSVTGIGDSAFKGCSSLTSITIPNYIISIGDSAFASCASLTAITISSINSIYSSVDGVLFNKSKTTLIQCPGGIAGSYTIPNSVTSIGDGAFKSCARLTSVTIPNYVTSIGDSAFKGCSSLTSITIPNSVTSIGDLAFKGCASLTAITVGSGNSVYGSVDGVLFNNSKTTLIQYPGGIAGSYTIPNSVTSIGDGAFKSCTGLTSVTIPNYVTNIGDSAFKGCSSLTSVTIPTSITSIGNCAFYDCANLTAIMVGSGNSVYSSADGVLFDKSKTTLIQCPGGIAGSYTIPSSVTSIGDAAFWGCNGLTSIAIPNSVTSIGNCAFYNCASLTAITVGSINSVYGSADGVLFNNSKTTLIQCPEGKAGSYTIPNSVTSIGNAAFWGCAGLTSIIIPNYVTSIGDAAFASCASLTAITVGSANSIYGSVDGVLFNKSKTTLIQCPGGQAGSYTIPNNVTSIEDGTFKDCTGLTSITIPYSVTSIEDEVFPDCTGLTSVTIPGSVTNIGNSGFYDCAGLKGVYFKGNAPVIGSSVFEGDNNATIYYLPGTTGWGTTFGGRPTMPWNAIGPKTCGCPPALWNVIGPMIKANGAKDNVTVYYPETVSVKVEMNADIYAGIDVDWWIIARAGSSWFYLNNSFQWTEFDGNISNCHPVYQGALFNLPLTEVLNIILTSGSYTFWFAIDYPMDGILKLEGSILVDAVNVTVR